MKTLIEMMRDQQSVASKIRDRFLTMAYAEPYFSYRFDYNSEGLEPKFTAWCLFDQTVTPRPKLLEMIFEHGELYIVDFGAYEEESVEMLSIAQKILAQIIDLDDCKKDDKDFF